MPGKRQIRSEKAPPAIGPYSQAIAANGFLFVSGQLPLTPEGRLVEGGIAEQARQCLQNIRGILLSAGLDIDALVKVTVFATDMAIFELFNREYTAFFEGKTPPARSFVQVVALPKGVPIEIEAIAAFSVET